MNFTWQGVFPALTTPFNAEGNPDLALYGKNLQAQVEAGIDGIVLAGSLGEASVLSLPEKEKLVKFSLENCDLPVVLTIAEGATAEAVQQAKLAAAWGVHGLMLLPPMRYKSDHRETVAYFKTVGEATELPVMLYNNPIDYRIEVTLDMLEELLPWTNINAIKESTRDVINVTRMINRFGDRYKILCGVDPLALEELCLGAHGWVAGLVCAFPKETVAIYRLVKAGRLEEARKIYRWFMPLLELDIHPKLVQYIKLATARTGIGSEIVRPPRLVLEGEERQRVLKIIDDGIATRPELPDYLNA